MAHSVEVRPPFLDHRIVEFAATLPSAFKIRGKQQKVILKKLMEKRLPVSVIGRSKTGFDIPAHEWLSGTAAVVAARYARKRRIRHALISIGVAYEHVVAQHLERRANLGYHLWGLLVLFLWMKRWRIQTTNNSGQTELAENVLSPT